MTFALRTEAAESFVCKWRETSPSAERAGFTSRACRPNLLQHSGVGASVGALLAQLQMLVSLRVQIAAVPIDDGFLLLTCLTNHTT